MRLHDICFVAAVLAGLTGMSAGIAMGIAGDFTLAPAHAHLNLLGWVSLALMGLYYRGAGYSRRRLALAQVTLAVAGFWGFPVTLGGYLWTHNEAVVPLAMAFSLLALAAMALFVVIVVLDVRDRTLVFGRLHPESG